MKRIGPAWGSLVEKTNKTKRKEEERDQPSDFFITFCLRTCAVVFKRMWQTSVHLWAVLALPCICRDSSENEIMPGAPFMTFCPLHLPRSSARWLPFGCGSNREPTPGSSVQIQGNPCTSVTLRFVNWRGLSCFTDSSQSSGSLSRRFLTGPRGPVARKPFPVYTWGKWRFFPACTVVVTVQFTRPSELVVVQLISQETLQKLPPASVIYVPC